jgi:hypothetical protein
MPWLRILLHLGIQDIGFGFLAAHEAICDETVDARRIIIIDHAPTPYALVFVTAARVASLATGFILDHSPWHRHFLPSAASIAAAALLSSFVNKWAYTFRVMLGLAWPSRFEIVTTSTPWEINMLAWVWRSV